MMDAQFTSEMNADTNSWEDKTMENPQITVFHRFSIFIFFYIVVMAVRDLKCNNKIDCMKNGVQLPPTNSLKSCKQIVTSFRVLVPFNFAWMQ